MTYSVYKPTGANGLNPIPVPDNAIDSALYDSANKLGVQLIGRNAIDYGTAVAQNTVQMVSNFAGTVAPSATIALQGQLWFNATGSSSGKLYLRTATGGTFPTGWEKVSTVNSSTPSDGDIQVVGAVISIWANGGWQQVFPAVYS